MKDLFYIRGVKDRGDEVIKALEEKGGHNTEGDGWDGEGADYIYYCIQGSAITYATEGTAEYSIITSIGTELFLSENPAPKVLKWDDIRVSRGYVASENILDYTQNSSRKLKSVFVTEQQAKSAQAASMISQIREQGKEFYGKIVPIGIDCWVIGKCEDADNDFKPCTWIFGHQSCKGGLLRFETQMKARLFLDNNGELVEEYLKIF